MQKTLKTKKNMLDIYTMSDEDLFTYLKQLQKSLNWNFEKLTRDDLIELIEMHFSNY